MEPGDGKWSKRVHHKSLLSEYRTIGKAFAFIRGKQMKMAMWDEGLSESTLFPEGSDLSANLDKMEVTRIANKNRRPLFRGLRDQARKLRLSEKVFGYDHKKRLGYEIFLIRKDIYSNKFVGSRAT